MANEEREFTDDEARTAWNRGAAAWLEFVHSGADYYRLEVHGPALLAVCEPLGGERVLDLGCGEGYFSRELARQGARVAAVDLSEELLGYARTREREERLGIDYHHLSAAEAAGQWEPATFDLVTGCMSLQDMSDVQGVLHGAYRLLRPQGRMVFSVPHPGTDTPMRSWEQDERGEKLALKIDRYFDTGPALCEWNMPRLAYPWMTPFWRHTLEEWTAMIVAAGFLIRRLREPHPTAEQVERRPELEDCSRLPYFLIFELLRP
ncbi:MAG TPA: class I SAM-dependent methyltransferase [Longimicrobiaceae bacterium]|nr:class I SAM-dependent methyltransferase [Longimicrobiaceae bacterium]